VEVLEREITRLASQALRYPEVAKAVEAMAEILKKCPYA
jgi:hypothetical protein